MNYVPYQKCPVCNGQGMLNTPTDYIPYKPCTTCNGFKIIPLCPVAEIPKPVESEIDKKLKALDKSFTSLLESATIPLRISNLFKDFLLKYGELKSELCDTKK